MNPATHQLPRACSTQAPRHRKNFSCRYIARATSSENPFDVAHAVACVNTRPRYVFMRDPSSRVGSSTIQVDDECPKMSPLVIFDPRDL
jgi:hypothetical protein